ncbi:hypothetical protein M413DRAFT_373720 [Hebeloma cylindrosporum]|uniref:Protein kinase domain-containing protein n=1 Tax=Hebeloma cylindrosporum TaxID=76867 RepID=A0A0C2Y2G6_HEBCY|nr:hypothetical protein M413DRAFT_373720 [Hebeloma cylindrosporum h7]
MLPVDSQGPTPDVSSSAPSTPRLNAALPTASSISSISSQRPPRKSIPSARRRELVWKSQKNEAVSLEDIAHQFQSFLLTFSTDLGFNRRRGRYITKTAHRCPGYTRIEITLTSDIARSAIVSHLTPTPHEICPVCKEIVKDAEIFAGICGRDDNESIPTIRCSTCSEWHHRPCVRVYENTDQSFVCQRCKVQTTPEPIAIDLFSKLDHVQPFGRTEGRPPQTASTWLQNAETPPTLGPFNPHSGTLIDGGSLELAEVLGAGGHGIIYRAVDTRYPAGQKFYAVKCLVNTGYQAARQRQIHIREIALHQLASAHPGVITLHRVVEQGAHTYLIMDYAPDHDLSTQILHSCRYLGDDVLIKDVFLQLLDAVEYCHSLGIYHQDLHPGNILCFHDGLRIAITNFGHATTDKLSDEFCTGSIDYMSPECQGREFAPTGNYSPMFNDIWSLGIILLNLVTGRKPWKSATPGDPTFQAYLRDPMGFLPRVLPISLEINDILVRMLEVDWRERMGLREIRYAIEEVTRFYSDGVVFEDTMARCPWEAGMDIGMVSTDTAAKDRPHGLGSPTPENVEHLSNWSKDSTSNTGFATQTLVEGPSNGPPWERYPSDSKNWSPKLFGPSPPTTPLPSTPNSPDLTFWERYSSDSKNWSPKLPLFGPSPPITPLPSRPNSPDLTFGSKIEKPEPQFLAINTNLPRVCFYDTNV